MRTLSVIGYVILNLNKEKKKGEDLRICDTEFSTSDNNVPKTTVPTYMANIENIRSSEF